MAPADPTGMDPASPSDELEGLADTLWEERQVVEYLLFKLVTAKLILAADERRFVASALEEVDRIGPTLRATEVQRAAALDAVAGTWGVAGDDLTLHELAERAEEPMASVFRDHQVAFAELASEIEETARENRQLACASLAHVRETIDALAGPGGRRHAPPPGAVETPLRMPARHDELR